MSASKNLCRNFQSGRCTYGSRCKFLHVNQQKPNAFGFGSQTSTPFQQTSSQQQNPNPFGFGVQNSGLANGSGGNKPFDNKWVRQGQPANQSQATQSQSANHECTDPAVCKRLITEDFQNERPLWKLSCYGHYKHLPCDITGDISFEELRAEAYSDAKRGLSIQAIVEREKNLEKSKLTECENLIRNPFTKQTQSGLPNQSLFPTVGTTFLSQTPQSVSSSLFPGLIPQQGSSPNMPNMSFGVRPSTPSNSGFEQFQGPGKFGSTSGPSVQGSFGTQVPAQAGGNFFPVQTSGNAFGPNTTIFGHGSSNSQSNQSPVQPGGNAFTPNQGGNLLSSFPVSSQQIQTPAVSQPPMLSNGLSNTISVEQRHMVQKEVLPTADASIWLKAEWKLGEIPEQPPPAEYVN